MKQIRSFLWLHILMLPLAFATDSSPIAYCIVLYELHYTCLMIIEIHFFLLGKYHLWQTKSMQHISKCPAGLTISLRLLLFMSVADLGLPGLPVWHRQGLALRLLHLACLYDGWPLRQLIGNGLIYDLLLPQSNGFISFSQPMMSQPRSFQQCPSPLLWFLRVDDQWRGGVSKYMETHFLCLCIQFLACLCKSLIYCYCVCFGKVKA